MPETAATLAERKLRARLRPEGDPHPPQSGEQKRLWLLACVALLALVGSYANHFGNGFHFDDAHAVVTNVYIRDLRNVPRFFTDGRTFSSLPTNQSWRPLVSTSLALDYRLGHGLKPFWFQLSTFIWFVVQLVLMFLLYRGLLDGAAPGPANAYIALFTVMWYGLHPANAETVNYVIQRGDLYATLGVVAGLTLYIAFPGLRKFGIYLLPVVLGALSKPPAVVFCGILLVYIFLFEEDADWRRLLPAILKSLPAIVVCGILAVVNVKLTPKSFAPTILPSSMYWATQPYVILRYVRSLFLPLWLSADTDLRAFDSIWEPRALAGVVFCLALLAVAFCAVKRREHRPIAFGIFWFFAALAPTSVFVLSEVENDHRMFFPFVGLMVSVTWAAALVISRLTRRDPGRRPLILRAVQVVSVCLLIAYGIGTWKRNEVWHSDESLWRDVTLKSPENGRGLMNYGLTLMAKGDTQGALDYFQRAATFTPNYYVLEINTGIVLAVLGRPQESEAHFRRAITLQPNDAQPYYYYGRWLRSQGRSAEAIQMLRTALDRNPAFMDARYLLMQSYSEQAQWPELKALAQDTLSLAPGDAVAQSYLTRIGNRPDPVAAAKLLVESHPTPENYLNLSLVYHRAGRYPECIEAAKKALRLKPDYAEAYNNIAAAYEAMQQWDPAIAAAQQALRLKPDFTLARNNLAYSQAQKRLKGH
jgi:tetratricopeptide (TPR) repeat protein